MSLLGDLIPFFLPRAQAQAKQRVVGANTTAALDEVLVVNANCTITDPAPITGRGYWVWVINGTATIGGTGYAAPAYFFRRYHSGSWANTTPTSSTVTAPALNDVVALDMTRAPGSYLQSSGVSGSGIVYTGGSRQNIAGVPVVEFTFEILVGASAPAVAERTIMIGSSASSPGNHSLALTRTTGGSIVVTREGATAGVNQRTATLSSFQTDYAGRRVRLSLVLTDGATTVAFRANGVDRSADLTYVASGSPPPFLDSALTTSFFVVGLNFPAGEHVICTPILGSLSTTERDTWFTTGRFPAWVHAGGSAVGLLTNTGFEVDTSGWAAQSGGTFTRITSDFQSGVACAEIVAASAGQGIRTDAGVISTDNALMCGFWAKSVSGNTSLTLSRGNGSNPVAFALTSSWQFFVYATNSVATNAPSTGTNYVSFTLGGAGTFRLDNAQVWRAGALTLPGVQGIGVVRDLTTIGGNQGRLVGITPCLAVSVPMNSIERPAESYTAATSVQLLGGAITGGRKRRLVSVSGNSSASVNLSLGTSSGGTQLVNAQAVNGDFDISTFASRILAANSSLWLTFSGNTTASIVIQVTDL